MDLDKDHVYDDEEVVVVVVDVNVDYQHHFLSKFEILFFIFIE